MTHRQFRAFLDFLMNADPWPEAVDHNTIRSLADDLSQSMGFSDWIDAYHRFSPKE